MNWILVSEKKPETRVPVLCLVDGKAITVAEYVAPKTILAEDYMDEIYDFDESLYDEAIDNYWCPEGWFEHQTYTDTNFVVSGTVTHWMPLPAKPTADQ